MTTRVPIRYGGTGANTAAGARAALGVLANTGGTISGDLTITGNLIVSGNTTTLNTETLVIEDADIVLLSNVTGSPVLNAGITINRGNSTNTFLRWDEGADKWGWSDDGTNTYTFDTALSAYSQANAAYTAANNAKVTVFANNSSNVTTQNINFVNTSTVTVTVSADGSNANVAFTAAPQTVVVDTYAASGNTTAAATANIANGLFAIATDAYAQGNSAYTAANNAANTVRVSQNSTSTLSAKQLNFVNTANVTIVVADSGNGNANISFEVASGTGTLSNIGISSNGVFTTNANAFNFVNTSTVSVSVSSGVNGNANIAFNATVAGVNTVIRSETFTSANAAANLTYNILYYPVAVEYVFVNKNGIGLFPTTDYTLSGNTVTIKEAGESGDNIEIRYFVDVSTVPVSNTTIIVEANTVTAQTNTFTLSQNVATINRLSVTKNGLQLTPNTHYTLANGKTVTLTTLAEVDDQIVFRYFFDLGNIQDVGFTAYQQANAAYDQANLAYTAANNRVLKTGDTLTGTLNVQNVIPTTSNTYNLGSSSARFKDLWLSNSTIYLGDSSISANAGKIIVPAIETSSGINLESQVAAAYGQANSAYGQANAGYTQANSAYTAANTAQTTAQNAYGQANSAYLQANTAYLAANNSNLKLGGVISGTLNVTNDIIVGGNVYLQGNTTFINVATYQINDALMYIAANNTLTDSVDIGFVGGKNTSGTFSHTGLARDATDGKYKLFDNLADSGHVGNVIDFANTSLATLVANVEANTLSVVNGVSGNVNFDSGTLFVNSVGNAVGIGTTNPAYKLDVNNSAGETIAQFVNGVGRGYVRMDGYDDMTLQFYRRGASVAFIQTDTSGTEFYAGTSGAYPFTFYTNNTEKMRITSAGNIGIGTTSPGTKLDIASAQGSGLTMRYDATTAYRALITPYWNSGTDTRIDFAINSVANQTPSVYMSVGYNGGNVGIGTTSPGAKLDVFGGIRSTTSSTTGTAFSEYLNDLGTMVLQIGLFGSAKSGTTFGLNNANLAFMYTTTYTSGHPSALAIGTTSSQPLVFGTGAAERMRIDGSGNVGIGTTNPGFKLDVNGGIGLSSQSPIAFYSNGNTGTYTQTVIYANQNNTSGSITNGIFIERGRLTDSSSGEIRSFVVGSRGGETQFIITGPGNVGIGTTSPAYKVQINRTDPDALGIFRALDVGVVGAAGTFFDLGALSGSTATAGARIIGVLNNPATSGYITFSTLNSSTMSERMIITAAGNVGVNQTSPSYNVHIGKAASGDNHDYGLLVERHGTGASPGSWSTTKAAINIIDTANAGPSSADTTGVFSLNFGRMSVSSSNAKYASLTHIGYDSGAESPWRIDGKGNHWVGWNRNTSQTNDGSFCLLVRKGVSVGTNYQTTTPPDNGAIIEGNVGIGITNPQVKLEVLDEHRIRGTAINRTNIESQSQTKFAGTSGTATLSAPASTETNYIKKFFMMNGTAGTTALNQTLATIDSRNISFHEAWVKITWGTRIQGVTDSTCALNERAFGINKFNGVNNAYTITNSWSHVDANSDAHMDINVVNSGTGGICLIQYQQSASTGASSFIWGYIEICSCEAMDQSGQVSVSFNC